MPVVFPNHQFCVPKYGVFSGTEAYDDPQGSYEVRADKLTRFIVPFCGGGWIRESQPSRFDREKVLVLNGA